MTKPFTDTLLKNLGPDPSRTPCTDGKATGLLYVPSTSTKGRGVFYFRYSFDNKRKRLKLGAYPGLTLGAARSAASASQAVLDKGGDPAADKEAAKRSREASEARTYEAVVDDFITKYAEPRQRTAAETKRVLKTACPKWLNRPFDGITKAEAYSLLDGFVAEGKHAKARITLAWLRTLWRWAWRRDLVATPIMDAVEIEFERRIRERHFSDAEVKAVWKAVDAEPITPVDGAYIKLLILLGTRKGELAGMRWSEFDDVDKPTLWTVPHERTKSKKRSKRERVYIVPLPPLAQRIIKGLRPADGPQSDERYFCKAELRASPNSNL